MLQRLLDCQLPTLNGATLTVTAAGTVTVTASQAGLSDYLAPSSLGRTFNALAANAVTGILDEIKSTLRVYPNPTTNSLRFDFGGSTNDELTIELMDLWAKSILTITLTHQQALRRFHLMYPTWKAAFICTLFLPVTTIYPGDLSRTEISHNYII